MKFFNISYENKNESVECTKDIYNIKLNNEYNQNNIILFENLLSTTSINYIYVNNGKRNLKFLEMIYPIKFVNKPISQTSNLNKL